MMIRRQMTKGSAAERTTATTFSGKADARKRGPKI
jgi:hypothetical protein